jgi:hypothetical protein
VKNRFQNLPFKCNLQRYFEVELDAADLKDNLEDTGAPWWGAARWNQVDP